MAFAKIKRTNLNRGTQQKKSVCATEFVINRLEFKAMMSSLGLLMVGRIIRLSLSESFYDT